MAGGLRTWGTWTLHGRVSLSEPMQVGLAGRRRQGQGSARGAGAGWSRGGCQGSSLTVREASLPPSPAGKQRQEPPWQAVHTGPEDWPGADTLTELPGACPHTGGTEGGWG